MPAIDSRDPAMPGTAALHDDISAEILDLKKKIGATILAHYYQEGDIQALADITGDSLKLAREATKVDSPVIVFCGVLFMAETAKMLNPTKTVLLPDLHGRVQPRGLPARRTSCQRYQEMLRVNGRKFQTVTYINSFREGEGTLATGSSPAATRRRWCANKVPPGYEILFVPDKHLGRYLQEVTGREMILWDGSCMVHEIFSVHDLLKHEEGAPEGEDDRAPGVPEEHSRTTRSSSAARRR